MSQNFLAVQVVDGELGIIRERSTWEEIINVAVAMVSNFSPKDSIESIRESFEQDSEWVSHDGIITLSIVQAENE